MSRPIPGEFYTVQNGDTYPKIAAKAYGLEELWVQIRDANQQLLPTSGAETIEAGEAIYIPEDQTNIELNNLQGRA